MSDPPDAPILAVPTSSAGLVLVHPPDEHGDAATLARRLRGNHADVTMVALSKSLIDDLGAAHPDVVAISYRPGSFELPRLCRDLRASIDAPVVVAVTGATVHQLDDIVVTALDAGADEVLPADATSRVLRARVAALRRNRSRTLRPTRAITIGDVSIDADGHLVRIAGEITKVRPIHFRLLLVLARQAGVIVGPEQLLREVWGGDVWGAAGAVDTRRVRIAISRLRQTLGEGPLRPVIETVARLGYRLAVPSPAAAPPT